MLLREPFLFLNRPFLIGDDVNDGRRCWKQLFCLSAGEVLNCSSVPCSSVQFNAENRGRPASRSDMPQADA